MKFFAVLVAVCLLPQAALAATRDCKTVADPTLRLACYDQLNPPVGRGQMLSPTVAQPVPPPRADGNAAYRGSADDNDDAQVNAMMHNICRGW